LAKVVGPLQSVEARGKCGALVYNSWRGVQWCKTYVLLDPLPTAAQSSHRLAFKLASKAWKTLTDAQRSLWETYARQRSRPDWTGKQIELSGFAAYMSCNCYLSDHATTLLTVPPPQLVVPCTRTFQVSTDHVTTVIFTWGYPEDDLFHYSLQCRFHGPVSYGAKPDFKKARLFYEIDFSDGTIDCTGEVFHPLGRYGVWWRPVHILYGVYGSWEGTTIDDPWSEGEEKGLRILPQKPPL